MRESTGSDKRARFAGVSEDDTRTHTLPFTFCGVSRWIDERIQSRHGFNSNRIGLPNF